MKDIGGKLMGVVVLAGILFGVFVVLFIPAELLQKADAESWPSRKGTITTSYASYHASFSRSGSPFWRAEICGTYDDSGERFCARHIRFGGFRFGDGKAGVMETVARYPVGRRVDVYFSPDDPKETLLEARSSWQEMFTLLGLAVAFLVLPILLWLFRKKIDPRRYAGAGHLE